MYQDYENYIDLPFSTHSLGGSIAFKISSLLGLVSIGGSYVFLFYANIQKKWIVKQAFQYMMYFAYSQNFSYMDH
jgi:hypothetical protein